MNVEIFNHFPWTPLVLLWLSYTFLGWYLSVHHIIWVVGILVAGLVITLVGQSLSWLEQLIRCGSQFLIVVLCLSASVALIAAWSLFITFILAPLASSILAEIELRFAGFSKRDALLLLSLVAAFGLAAGETIDVFFMPSSRY